MQRIPFAQTADNGKPDPLVCITANLHKNAIVGLVFDYESSESRPVGKTDTDDCRTVWVPKCSRIAGFCRTTVDSSLKELEVTSWIYVMGETDLVDGSFT